VNRLVCKGEAFEADLIIDVASEVYNLREGDKFTLTLAGTLRLDGKPDDDYFNQDGQVRAQAAPAWDDTGKGA
jgi:hypothetical protein